MSTYIYIPFDAFKRSGWSTDSSKFYSKPHVIVGYRIENCYVVVDIIEDAYDSAVSEPNSRLKIIGHTNLDDEVDSAGAHIYLQFDSASKLPYVDPRFYGSNDKFTIIFFAPPNLRNMEYFTLRPILLQSANTAKNSESHVKAVSQLQAGGDTCNQLSICNETIIDCVNTCSRDRATLRTQVDKSKHIFTGENKSFISHTAFETLNRATKELVFRSVGCFIAVMVWSIKNLNTDVFGKKLVERSAWCRQLDLRLRQISFFPFQFLSYYDINFLTIDTQNELGIPLSNERHNINNSSYINLYNTIWLIINDILIGHTAYRLISVRLVSRMSRLNGLLHDLCYSKLDSFISWIGSEYPGGLKLNTDLGQFMELLFLWTSQSCGEVFHYLILSSTERALFLYVMRCWLILSCYCGVSFLVAFFIDYVEIVNVHSFLFSLAATKIYRRQMDMLKSLMQLFRGRKYNVLRNRIDRIEEDQLRIDQLLLGTFVFLVLIYLLPTTFAFYVLFYAFRLSMSTLLKLGKKLILCFNIYPLFVILLKLKNSRRLQGGVHFTDMGDHKKTVWLLMENEALTFEEIYGNFVHLLRQEGRIDRLLRNFAEGIDLQERDTSSEKFHYLMLPRNYEILAEIWRKKVCNVRK